MSWTNSINYGLMSENSSTTYNVKVNEFEFSFTQDEIDKADLVQKTPGVFHLIKNRKSLNAVLLKADESSKTQTIQVEGETFNVQIKDELDVMLDKMGFNTTAG